MIKKIKWVKNSELVKKFKEKNPGYESYADETKEEIEILFSNNTLIYSADYESKSKNSVGKSVIFYSLQYVLGEHKNNKDDALIGTINAKYKELLKEGFKSEDYFIFLYDIYLWDENDNILFRKINFNKEKENPFSITEQWTYNGSKKKRNELMNEILPKFYVTWPKRYGFGNIIFDGKRSVENFKLSSFSYISVHEYNQFLYKKQLLSGDKTSSGSFFEKYMYWSDVNFRCLAYSIFIKDKNIKYKKDNLSKLFSNFGTDSDKISELKSQKYFLNKEIKPISTKRKMGINEDLIKELKEIKAKINNQSDKLQIYLNDFYNEEDKLDKSYLSFENITNKKPIDIETALEIKEYIFLAQKLDNLWSENKTKKFDELVIIEFIKQNLDFKISEIEKKITELNNKNHSLLEEAGEYYKEIYQQSEEVINKMYSTLFKSGADLTISEFGILDDLIKNSNKLPYVYIDEMFIATDEDSKKKEIVEHLMNFSSTNNIEQTIITSAQLDENNKKIIRDSNNDFSLIRIDEQFFKNGEIEYE